MKRERQCKFCLRGPVKVKNSFRKGTIQVRNMLCTSCGREFRETVHADDVLRFTKKKTERRLRRRKGITTIETALESSEGKKPCEGTTP